MRDIVELQLSFIVVPLHDQNSRMSIVLRSISLLEGKFAGEEINLDKQNIIERSVEQEAFVKAASTRIPTKINTTKATLKRKVGYMDEAVSITRTKLSQMKIVEATGVEGRDERLIRCD
jgi:hypothetical protein